MSYKKQKVGIIGLGFVGSSVYHWFKHKLNDKVELFSYDKYKNIGSIKEINKADIIFICVPTPFHEDANGYDDSAVIESLKILSGPKIVVIKSTILPGSTEKYQKLFPKHKILFNPEFLVAKTAVKDFLKPNRQIIGYTNKSKNDAQNILNILPPAPFIRIVPATEAETIKYFGNAFLSTKVIFANQIYSLCEKLGINYDIVKESAAVDPRIGHSHLDIFLDGYRGYRGACFPKDMKAFIGLAKKLGVSFDLLEKADEINDILTKQMTKPYVSVIITTFNRPKYLKEAITSVLKQDFADFELIIVDDCSPGTKTQGTINSFNDGRIKYIRNKKNLGGNISLNVGLKAATGKYIAILDDDDVWISNEKLSQQVKFLEKNPEYVLVGTNIVVADYDTGEKILKSNAPYYDDDIRRRILLSNPIAHSSILCRREAMLKVGGYDESLPRGKDYDILLKLGTIGKLAVLPDYAVKYRLPSSKQRNIFKMRVGDTGAKIKIIWRYRKNYACAIRVLIREIFKYILFYLAQPFHKIISPIYETARKNRLTQGL